MMQIGALTRSFALYDLCALRQLQLILNGV